MRVAAVDALLKLPGGKPAGWNELTYIPRMIHLLTKRTNRPNLSPRTAARVLWAECQAT